MSAKGLWKENQTAVLPSSYQFDSAGLISDGYITIRLCSLHTFSYNQSTQLTHPLTVTETCICTFTAATQR